MLLSFTFSQRFRRTAALALLVLSAFVGGCKGSKSEPPKTPAQPSLRLYVASTIAGALEPCGCRKDMLGGVDHAAALIESRKAEAPQALVVGAGPMLFMNPELTPERSAQDSWKAESLAAAFSELGLSAWAPGANDFAAGPEMLSQLAARSGAQVLAANLGLKDVKKPVAASAFVRRAGEQIVGLAGVSIPKYKGFVMPPLVAGDAAEALTKAREDLKRQGSTINIALVAAPRGDALRLAEHVPGFQVFIVGKPSDSGEANDAPTPPVLVGNTLVVQAPNHLQALGVVDLFVRDDSRVFADATGIALQERRDSLSHRIAELERRLVRWKADSKVAVEDVAARDQELIALRAELDGLGKPALPSKGSFFRYELTEVRESFGEHAGVKANMLSYYKRVNEHNKTLFKDRKPKPAPKGESHFAGVGKCEECHEDAFAFWKKTGHAGAYETLTRDFKEFNLDCVSCHVTGYDKPGGSTVTFVDGLKDVQCESCHGAGSLHAEEEDESLITLKPATTVCKQCHHPPHVADDWNVEEAWSHIVGPGHGEDSKP